jgi:DNA-binding winged helix-turn-helix (wHTH) protein
MEIEYSRDLHLNYMIISESASGAVDPYCLKMLKAEGLEGILPLEQRMIDNKAFYYYDITAKEMKYDGEYRQMFVKLVEEIKSIADAIRLSFQTDIVIANLNVLDSMLHDDTSSLQRDLKAKKKTEMDELIFEDVTLNVHTGELFCGSHNISLSFKELEIMKILLSNPKMFITKEVLLIHVWGSETDVDENNVEAYISFLRKKLKFIKSRITIKNKKRLGYRLEEVEC